MFTLVLCADPSILGRFDKASLSDQNLMELFVGEFKDVDIAKDKDKNFISIEKWCVLHLDAAKYVTSINMSLGNVVFGGQQTLFRSIEEGCFDEGGPVDFQYVPPTVISLRIFHLYLTGTIETQDLPRGLKAFEIPSNKISGTFDTAALPGSLESVNVSYNKLEGSVHLESLPKALKYFQVQNNTFTGGLKLDVLPEGLISINLGHNRFEGEIKLINLPKSLQEVELDENLFPPDRRAIVEKPNGLQLLKLDFWMQHLVFDCNGVKYTGKELVCEDPYPTDDDSWDDDEY